MNRLVNLILAAAITTTLAACASQPQPAPDAQSYTPPQQRLDAKTQLETGRTYR